MGLPEGEPSSSRVVQHAAMTDGPRRCKVAHLADEQARNLGQLARRGERPGQRPCARGRRVNLARPIGIICNAMRPPTASALPSSSVTRASPPEAREPVSVQDPFAMWNR